MNNLDDIISKVPRKFLKGDYSVKILGNGENNVNYLLKSKEKSYVLRVSNNKKRLKQEFAIMKLLPVGIAPKTFFLATSKNKSFMLQEFIKGTHPRIWTKMMLKKFARQLAALHSIKSKYAQYDDKKNKIIDVKRYLDHINEFFLKDAPKLKLDKDIIYFDKKIKILIMKNRELFAKKRSFSFTHGDLASINILQNGNKMTIIDWEFAVFFDNARDFSTFCYDDINHNDSKWRIKLNKKEMDIFLNEYSKFFKDENLKERVNFWIQIDKYCSLIYLKWKLYKSDYATLSRKQIEYGIKKLIKSLSKHLK